MNEIKCNIFGWVWLGIQKVTRYRTAVPNEIILVNRQEFFFTKVTFVQSIIDIVLLDSWLILLSWMFISSYATIYFFVKKFIFLNAYISVNTIFACNILFSWERGHQLSTYATGGNGRSSKKIQDLRKAGNFKAFYLCFYWNRNSWIWTVICGVVVIAAAPLHSAKSELRFWAGSNPACGMPQIRDGEDLW